MGRPRDIEIVQKAIDRLKKRLQKEIAEKTAALEALELVEQVES